MYISSLKIDEGKAQSIAMLTPLVGKDRAVSAVRELTKHDPTSPKNKYLDVLTKSLKAILVVTNKASVDPTKSYMVFLDRLKDEKVYDKLENIESRNLTLNQSKIKDFPSFMEELDRVYHTITKSTKKLGMRGIKENKDYIEVPLPVDDVKAYIPLHYKASKIIASDRVGGCEGEWCTAWQKTDEHWIDYIETKGGVLVYIIDDSPSIDNHSDLKKTAIYFYKDFVGKEVFNRRDKAINAYDIPNYLYIEKYVKANVDKIKKALAKNFKPIDPTKMLYDAIDNGNFNKVKEAIELGADVKYGYEPRTRSALGQTIYLYFNEGIDRKDFTDIVELLTTHGADWNEVYGANYSNEVPPVIAFFQGLKENGNLRGGAMESWLLNTLKVKISDHNMKRINDLMSESKKYKSKFRRIT